jgi:hypothetical protein
VSWLARLLGERYRPVAPLSALVDAAANERGRAGHTAASVALEGVVELIGTVPHPESGEGVVAVQYSAWPPSTTVGLDGTSALLSRGFKVTARQAADFVLTDGAVRVRVRVPAGDDVARLHRELLQRFGVQLRTQVEVVRPGARVRVLGRVIERVAASSPHRREPHHAVVDAHRFWTLVGGGER